MPFEARKFMFTVSLCAMLAVNPVLATAATTVEGETTTVPSSPELNDGKLHLASVDFVKRSMASVDPQDRVSVYQGNKNKNLAMVTDKDGTVYPGYIKSYMIANEAVYSGHIAAGAVYSGHIADGAVYSGHIAAGAVTSGAIATGAVNAEHVGGNTDDAGKVLMLNGSGRGYWGTLVGGGELQSGPTGSVLVTNASGIQWIDGAEGQVLMQGASGQVYWGTPEGGGDLQSGLTGSVLVTNASGIQWINGTEGQVLMQGASGKVYWGTPAGGGYDGGMVTADMINPRGVSGVLWGTGATAEWRMVDPRMIAGGYTGQVLMTDSAGNAYWGTPEGGGYDGGTVTPDMITGSTGDAGKVLMLDGSGHGYWGTPSGGGYDSGMVPADMITGSTGNAGKVLMLNTSGYGAWGMVPAEMITGTSYNYNKILMLNESGHAGWEKVTPDMIADGAVTTDKIAGGYTGQVLMTNSAGNAYWGTLVGGGDLQAGTTGSVLVTNASGIQWINGTEGQVLMQGASGRVYWGTPAGGGYDGGMVTAYMITGTSYDYNKILMLNDSGRAGWEKVTPDMISGYITTGVLLSNASGGVSWGAITSNFIAYGAVTSGAIAAGAVTPGAIADDAVTTDKVADGAITRDKTDGIVGTVPVGNASDPTSYATFWLEE